MGVVKAVYNFGAGDMLEIGDIPNVKGVRLVPFTRENVPEVRIEQRRITVASNALVLNEE